MCPRNVMAFRSVMVIGASALVCGLMVTDGSKRLLRVVMALNPTLLPERLNPLPVNGETFILYRRHLSLPNLHCHSPLHSEHRLSLRSAWKPSAWVYPCLSGWAESCSDGRVCMRRHFFG